MPNKIESAIKKFMSKNERAAGRMKKKKVIESVADTTMSDEEALKKEMARRQAFSPTQLRDVLRDRPPKKPKRKVK